MYLVIEGIDTAGKSTQLKLLEKKFSKAIFTKEPGGTSIGKVLRSLVLDASLVSKEAEMFVFLADRAEHYEKVIKPNRNKLLISDRGFVSGIAYAKDFDFDTLISLNKIALQNDLPDKIIMLELRKSELEKRLSKKAKDGIEARGLDYLIEIQSRMKIIIQKLQLDSLIIDAELPIAVIENKIELFIMEK